MTFRTRWENWKAKANRRRLDKEHNRVVKEAKQKNDDGILGAWEDTHEWEFEIIDAQINENLSRDVLDEARKLYLSTPSPNDKGKWESDVIKSINTGHRWWVLTPQAMTELNTEIRKEKQARREGIVWWIKVIAVLTGFVGAVSGLVAVWKK